MAKQKQDISRIWGERTQKHRAFKPHKPFPVMHHTSHGLLNLKIVFPNLLFCKPKWERWGFFLQPACRNKTVPNSPACHPTAQITKEKFPATTSSGELWD